MELRSHNLPNEGQDDLNLSEIFLVLQRRIWAFGGVVGALLLLGIAVVLFATPRYTAEALIMIESDGSPQMVTIESVVRSLSGDQESVQSEAHILSSRSLATRVVEKLGLESDPEFVDPGLEASTSRSVAVEEFLEHLTVLPLEDSRVIALRFESSEAEKAAMIVNTLADEYLQSRLETKYELTAQANKWLSGRIASLRDEVANAEAAVEQSRGEFGLVEGAGAMLASQELTELNTQLVIARSARAEAEARLAHVRSANGASESMMEVLGSPLIQRLREQEAQVERRVAELSSELGELHPRMVQLRAEAADLQGRIDEEVDKVVAGLRNQVNVARSREASLEESLDELKSEAAVAGQNQISLRALEREADATRDLLNTLLARQKETLSQDDGDFQQADASIVARADAPIEPSFPQIPIVLGLSLLSGLVIGSLVVLLLELADGGLRSGEQLERVVGVGAIGLIPEVENLDEYKSFPAYLAGETTSIFHEAVRNVYWSLKLASPDRSPRTLLVTSSVSGEGKTVLASSLATAQSMAGQRVLLIDGDIRRPGVHEQMEVSREPGLTNVLAGSVTVDEAIVERSWSSLKVLPAGMPSPNAPTLLGSQAMKSMLEDLQSRFDLIVIDSPPIMAASDARILAQMTDVTILLARWGKTRRPVVKSAVSQLHAAGIPLVVGLLSMVDMRRNATYGYGDSSVYGAEVSGYHTA